MVVVADWSIWGDVRYDAASEVIMSNLDTQFQKAADAVKDLSSRPDNKTLLKLYALFKQGSIGDVEGEQPGAFDFKARAKFDAWLDLEGIDPEEAKQSYVDLVNSLLADD